MSCFVIGAHHRHASMSRHFHNVVEINENQLSQLFVVRLSWQMIRDLRLYYIHPTAAQISPPHDNLNVFQYGMRLAASFSSAHVRQTTFTDFSYQRLDDRVAIQSALNMGLALERPRRWIAYRNKTSFSDLVNPPVKIESLTIEKIVALVSSLFLILFYVGFMVCLVLEPGSIVFQGNGIVLTLAAVIMAAGGGLSVLTIAIASCSWWLSSKENRNADYQTAS